MNFDQNKSPVELPVPFEKIDIRIQKALEQFGKRAKWGFEQSADYKNGEFVSVNGFWNNIKFPGVIPHIDQSDVHRNWNYVVDLAETLREKGYVLEDVRASDHALLNIKISRAEDFDI